ncbi:unnamed protein product [Blepharisma stoltei]|uniref:Uncharacterized protein n=1 Tax=Blepharisma stoltei TaxID=1481888 RepID=A0AAU9JW08_9CILI|nr:unnamed protein product [Blepharisma stoltei]
MEQVDPQSNTSSNYSTKEPDLIIDLKDSNTDFISLSKETHDLNRMSKKTEEKLNLADSDHEENNSGSDSENEEFSANHRSQDITEIRMIEEPTRKVHSVTIPPVKANQFSTNRSEQGQNHYNQGRFNKPDPFQEIINLQSPITAVSAFDEKKSQGDLEGTEYGSEAKLSVNSPRKASNRLRATSNFTNKTEEFMENHDDRARSQCVKCILQ